MPSPNIPMQHDVSSQGNQIILSPAILADLFPSLVWGTNPRERNSKDLVASDKEGHQTSATSRSPQATGKRNSNNPQIHKDEKLLSWPPANQILHRRYFRKLSCRNQKQDRKMTQMAFSHCAEYILEE